MLTVLFVAAQDWDTVQAFQTSLVVNTELETSASTSKHHRHQPLINQVVAVHVPINSCTGVNHVLFANNNDDNNFGEMNDDEQTTTQESLVGTVGLISQPIVWSSLYLVRTTGGGYPAGPFGILGLVEGVSYLVVVYLAATSLWKNVVTGGRFYKENIPPLVGKAETLSVVTLVVALLVLLSLVADQGCVPNAKPILDYSEYLPICSSSPGLFGQ